MTPRRRPRRCLHASSGTATITGVEPSCLLTLREEHPGLIGDKGIAERTRLVEELLVEAIDDGALHLNDLGPRRDPLSRPLPPEGARRHRGHGRAARTHPRRRGRRARRRLLRDGRLVRLRGRALRVEHAHRRDAPVPRGSAGARGDADRRHGRVVPPADRAWDRTVRAPPRAARQGCTSRLRERVDVNRSHFDPRTRRDLRDRHAAPDQHGPARHHGRVHRGHRRRGG